jgi:hypothetical protein
MAVAADDPYPNEREDMSRSGRDWTEGFHLSVVAAV